MKKGFTMFLNGKDYFFITTCKSINSKILLTKVCKFFNAPYNENTEKFLKSRLEPATLEYQDFSVMIKTKNGTISSPYCDDNTIIAGFTQKHRNLATKENIAKIKNAVEMAKEKYQKNPDYFHVKISRDNDKTGNTASVSTVPYLYCPECAKETCGKDCYALAMALDGHKPDILESWAMNTAILLIDPEKYNREVAAAVAISKYFRYHVSGDILNYAYFQNMIETAKKNPYCDILAFTKKYDIVNSYIDNNGHSLAALPENLKLLFSRWKGLIKVNNPYHLPETDVLDETETNKDGYKCGGNCFFCACVGVGCWQLKPGETIYFDSH